MRLESYFSFLTSHNLNTQPFVIIILIFLGLLFPVMAGSNEDWEEYHQPLTFEHVSSLSWSSFLGFRIISRILISFSIIVRASPRSLLIIARSYNRWTSFLYSSILLSSDKESYERPLVWPGLFYKLTIVWTNLWSGQVSSYNRMNQPLVWPGLFYNPSLNLTAELQIHWPLM